MKKIQFVEGGVCAAKGFSASGVHCGIRKSRTKKDLALIKSDVRASAAAVYTKNLVFGAPITVTRENLKDGYAQTVICNSGNANTCNANGVEIALGMCDIASEITNTDKNDVIVASTGVIGQKLDLTPIKAGAPALAQALSYSGSEDAANAIMTTDTSLKQIAVSFECGGAVCSLGGIAKGSGMIHPNMATMLVFLTTDADIPSDVLKKALSEDVGDSFNMVSVDGDTSTNDMLCIMANGMSGGKPVLEGTEDYKTFRRALFTVTSGLCRMIAKDGEGATKLLECLICGAKDGKTAKTAAKSVICSTLLKAAMFGANANWGRVLCALGYGGADIDISAVSVYFASVKGEIKVCECGAGVDFSEERAKEILTCDEIQIYIVLGVGCGTAAAWGCDLTYDYVKINGDYRT